MAGATQSRQDLGNPHVQVREVEDLVVVEDVQALDGDRNVNLLQQLTASSGFRVAGNERALASNTGSNGDDGAAGAVGVEALEVLAVVGVRAGCAREEK